MTNHRDEAERTLGDEGRVAMPPGTRVDLGVLHALLAIHDLLDERLPSNPRGRAGDESDADADQAPTYPPAPESAPQGDLCKVPWHDGTTRLVPEGTVVETDPGGLAQAVYVRENGFNYVNGKGCVRWDTATVLRVLDTAPEPPHAGIDPDSITEWTWCYVRDKHDRSEQVLQIKGGLVRPQTNLKGAPFPDRWTVITDDVRIGTGGAS